MGTLSSRVLLLNSSYEPMNVCSIKKAFTLLFLDKAEVVEVSNKSIRTINSSYACPSIIRLKKGTKIPRGKVELSRKNLFKRDGFKCAYCGSHDNLTVDHVLPKSRGGKSTWENLVTACGDCNNYKDNKLPHEVGLTLRVKPKVPNHITFLQQSIKNMDEVWKPYLYMT